MTDCRSRFGRGGAFPAIAPSRRTPVRIINPGESIDGDRTSFERGMTARMTMTLDKAAERPAGTPALSGAGPAVAVHLCFSGART
jgi:hypothetical protein